MLCQYFQRRVLFAILGIATQTLVQSLTADALPHWCDDAPLKDIAQRLDLLSVCAENIRLKVDTFELKYQSVFDKRHEQLLEELDYIKETLVNQNAQLGDYSNLIDVRSSFASLKYPEPEPIFTAKSSKVPREKTLPTSCAEALKPGAPSGVHQLALSGQKPFYVYCLQDPENGTAWTVLQRRKDGTENFQRIWQEYKLGFGNLYDEFWLGLEKMHALTDYKLHELWILMEDFNGVQKFAKYDGFAISNEDKKYALNVLGAYTGDAGDSLKSHAGRKFTTIDSDNDTWGDNCAKQYTGAWWYGACHTSNLNGQYLKGEYGKEKFGQGINWYSWLGHNYSLKYVHMAIRPRK